LEWTVPGTVLSGRRDKTDETEAQMRGMFLASGIVRSQVVDVSGLEAHAVQNWVKRGFLSPPVNKRYSCRQFCRILIINMLKSALPMEKICGLLSYINGQLDDESDDAIDDSQLYFAFVRVAAEYRFLREDKQALDEHIEATLANYREPYPGAKDRVKQVLKVMLAAWASSQLQREAEALLAQMN